jgi:hypothetical protein
MRGLEYRYECLVHSILPASNPTQEAYNRSEFDLRFKL